MKHKIFKTLAIVFFIAKLIDLIHLWIRLKYYPEAHIDYPRIYWWLTLATPFLAILFAALTNATTSSRRTKFIFAFLILLTIYMLILDLTQFFTQTGYLKK